MELGPKTVNQGIESNEPCLGLDPSLENVEAQRITPTGACRATQNNCSASYSAGPSRRRIPRGCEATGPDHVDASGDALWPRGPFEGLTNSIGGQGDKQGVEIAALSHVAQGGGSSQPTFAGFLLSADHPAMFRNRDAAYLKDPSRDFGGRTLEAWDSDKLARIEPAGLGETIDPSPR
jgi:hypothetical protein